MEIQHSSHEHPLVFTEAQHSGSGARVEGDCFSCEKPVLDEHRSFSCSTCKFYLHLACAQSSLQINHRLHPLHPLMLLPNQWGDTSYYCFLCGIKTHDFFCHCSSCEFTLCLDCTIRPKSAAGLFPKLHKHELMFIEKHNKESISYSCSACLKIISSPLYCCLECGFYLHKECAYLSPQINHPCHRKHSLVLITEPLSPSVCCSLCKETCWGFFYHCSFCKFQVDLRCVSPLGVIHDEEKHEHPFMLFPTQHSFICDACGTEGDYAPYLCTKCVVLVHKDCILLPPTLRIWRHEHRLSHIYFLPSQESKQWECCLCHDEVNTDHGSYYCKECENYIVHVNCLAKNGFSDCIPEELEEDFQRYQLTREMLESFPEGLTNLAACLICFIDETVQENEMHMAGRELVHFSHQHILKLSEEIDDQEGLKYCNGCMLSISGSFYCCPYKCDFFLHQTCAALLQKKQHWGHRHQVTLCSNDIFYCNSCRYECSGLSFVCNANCGYRLCLRCFAIPEQLKVEVHEEHSLFFDDHTHVQCSACGNNSSYSYRCKICNFNLDIRCVTRPQTARFRFHDHPLKLTHQDVEEDQEQRYCLICEEKRDPNHWFYRCEKCDYDAHAECVLGKYPFIKRGSSYKSNTHSHPLTFFQNDGRYPLCDICGERCDDLGVKCSESECDFICHWECEEAKGQLLSL